MPSKAAVIDGPNSELIGEPQGSDSEISSGEYPRADFSTLLGIGFLYFGIAVSMAMLFWPSVTQQLASGLLAFIAPQLNALHLGTHLTPGATLAQIVWVCGSVLLCIEPLRRSVGNKERHWAFFVFEVSMVLASLLPLLDIGNASAIMLRLAFAVQVMLWLGSLEGMSVCKAMLPWYWWQVWQGKLGETALAILGSEILSWGYSLFAINAASAWLCLIAGAVVMMRYGDACLRRGIRLPVAWCWVNYVYITTGVIQLLWVVLG
jgi:hypothetical protein